MESNMSATRKRPRKPHQSPPPPAYDTVRLLGGPLAGKVLRLQRSDRAQLYLRTDDGSLTTVYSGSTTSGELEHQRTYPTPTKRRRVVSLAQQRLSTCGPADVDSASPESKA